jgi:hypothetical protein
MTLSEELGIKNIRQVSTVTTVIEFEGSCRPATALEIRMWQLLDRLASGK